jgi:hypothetical protein
VQNQPQEKACLGALEQSDSVGNSVTDFALVGVIQSPSGFGWQGRGPEFGAVGSQHL